MDRYLAAFVSSNGLKFILFNSLGGSICLIRQLCFLQSKSGSSDVNETVGVKLRPLSRSRRADSRINRRKFVRRKSA